MGRQLVLLAVVLGLALSTSCTLPFGEPMTRAAQRAGASYARPMPIIRAQVVRGNGQGSGQGSGQVRVTVATDDDSARWAVLTPCSNVDAARMLIDANRYVAYASYPTVGPPGLFVEYPRRRVVVTLNWTLSSPTCYRAASVTEEGVRSLASPNRLEVIPPSPQG